MAVQENTLNPPSPFNCFRSIAIAVSTIVAILYLFGVLADNMQSVVARLLAGWDSLMWALSLGGNSFWFPVAGATFSASAAAWAFCVIFNYMPRVLVTPEQTCNNRTSKWLLLAIGAVCGVTFYLFFFAMRSVGDMVTFETTHKSIAFCVLHLLAIAPAGTFVLLFFIFVAGTAEQAP